jgi:hypothetical protein
MGMLGLGRSSLALTTSIIIRAPKPPSTIPTAWPTNLHRAPSFLSLLELGERGELLRTLDPGERGGLTLLAPPCHWICTAATLRLPHYGSSMPGREREEPWRCEHGAAWGERGSAWGREGADTTTERGRDGTDAMWGEHTRGNF